MKRLSAFLLITLCLTMILPGQLSASEEERLQQLAEAARKFYGEFRRWPDRLSDLCIYLPDAAERRDPAGKLPHWDPQSRSLRMTLPVAGELETRCLFVDALADPESLTRLGMERLLDEGEESLLAAWQSSGRRPESLSTDRDWSQRAVWHGVPGATLVWVPPRLQCILADEKLEWIIDTAAVEFQGRQARRQGRILAELLAGHLAGSDTLPVLLEELRQRADTEDAALYADPWGRHWNWHSPPPQLISAGADGLPGTEDDIVIGVPVWSRDVFELRAKQDLELAASSLLHFRMRRGVLPDGDPSWAVFQQSFGKAPRRDPLGNPLAWAGDPDRVICRGWDGLPDTDDDLVLPFAALPDTLKQDLTDRLLKELAASAVALEAAGGDTLEGWLPFVSGDWPDAWRMTDGWQRPMAVDFQVREIVSFGPDGQPGLEEGRGDDRVVRWPPPAKAAEKSAAAKKKPAAAEGKKGRRKAAPTRKKPKKTRSR